MKKTKYIAIKVKDLNHWLWFKTVNVTEKNGRFIGLDVWGHQGNFMEIDVDCREIVGRIHSDHPHYN